MARAKRYWLMKCEPEAYTIEDLERDGTTTWEGVRNFQARNTMRDDMKVGDGVLFYASNAEPSGVSGLAEISRAGYPDPYAFQKGQGQFPQAVAGAVNALIQDGSYKTILEKWGVEQGAVTTAQVNPSVSG